ncbi:hypothetical protein HDU76_009221 [Blyttiomyces sp. JEL0837]|nr:hypothetical protein HDU76_009221 [Blyttiomyces sp. JEL0837]
MVRSYGILKSSLNAAHRTDHKPVKRARSTLVEPVPVIPLLDDDDDDEDGDVYRRDHYERLRRSKEAALLEQIEASADLDDDGDAEESAEMWTIRLNYKGSTKPLSIRIPANATANDVLVAFAKQTSQDLKKLKLEFENDELDRDTVLRDEGIEDGDLLETNVLKTSPVRRNRMAADSPREVYYQVVDCQGSTFQDTTVDYVILSPNATVIDFRHTVLSALPRLLAGFEAPLVHVYLNRNDFANNSIEESIEQRLNRLGISFLPTDLRYLKNNDYIRYRALFDSHLPKDEKQDIINVAKSRIKSETRAVIRSLQANSILVDSLLSESNGQLKASFYYAFTESGDIMAAKVYNRESKASYDHEVDINEKLASHENIVKFAKNCSLPDDSRHFIIMPYFPRSASDLLKHYPKFPRQTIVTIVRDIFSALKHIHSRGYCFVDLKPANIMLKSSEEGRAVLVDFGATVRIGSYLKETTERYCLDWDGCLWNGESGLALPWYDSD